jgi:hypothetical protein
MKIKIIKSRGHELVPVDLVFLCYFFLILMLQNFVQVNGLKKENYKRICDKK